MAQSSKPMKRIAPPFLLAPLLALLLPAIVLAQRPSLNVYFQSTLKDAPYQKKTFAKVSSVWKAPASSAVPKVGSKAVVQAVFERSGKLRTAIVSMSSGSKEWDAAALAAVRGAAPLDPLPSSYGYPTIEIHFHIAVVP
jgi:periplasmic protein TonB